MAESEGDEPIEVPIQMDDMLGCDKKRLKIAADVLKLLLDDVLDGEDWGEMKPLVEEVRRLERQARAASKIKGDAP